ncbi:MAG: enoyl-CoA hydratase/isomerase family protein [Ilumatobacteraceae bacterium]|nr:enoyl-CoA hydratase/isomerase family protein [Ilumatobacteraceae bacterium]
MTSTLLGVLQINHHGAVQVLTLDRPQARNAIDHGLYMEIGEALTAAANDDAVNVVVVTGAGPVFCAGQDLNEMAAVATGGVSFAGGHGFPRMMDVLEGFPKPLIAAVNGAAAGIGLTMLLHFDIVFVGQSARLRVPFSELGVPPEAASSALLPERVGWQKAAELLFTSSWMSAQEAVQYGLALRLFADDALQAETLKMALHIASFNSRATRTAKELMLAARAGVSTAARRREDAAFSALFRSQRDLSD